MAAVATKYLVNPSLFTASEAQKLIAIEEYQKSTAHVENTSTLTTDNKFNLTPPMTTLCILAGKKNKLRAGDLLGALTANKSIAGKQIGKINIFDTITYVAVERAIAKQALKLLSEGKIKGKKFKVRKLS